MVGKHTVGGHMVFGSFVGFDYSYYNSPPGFCFLFFSLAARSHHMYRWYDSTELVEVLGAAYFVHGS